MGKHKDKPKDHDNDSTSKKKSKKHKKHKKKHSRSTLSGAEEIDVDVDVDVVNNDEMSCSSQDEGKIKLKIKFGGRTISTTEVPSDNTGEQGDDLHEDDELNKKEAKRKARSDKLEEDRWLEALEKGELDDSGGLKKVKNKSLMTARQKALHGDAKETGNYLMQLPMYPERTEEENEEFERKRKLRAKKRKQQMQQQIEETKTQTVEKLLTKTQKASKKDKDLKQTSGEDKQPHIRYVDRVDGPITLSFTHEMNFPMSSKKAKEPPNIVLCSVSGCCNPKKYSCSKTNFPVCSLQCYKTINTIKMEEVVT